MGLKWLIHEKRMFQRSLPYRLQSLKFLFTHREITTLHGLHPALWASSTLNRLPFRSPLSQHVRSYSCRQATKDQSGQVHSNEATIYALSTASGPAAIAIIRCSGPACTLIYDRLCPDKPIPKPRNAAVRSLYDPSDKGGKGSIVDSQALVLFFPSPATVSGEDVLEFHIHGGIAIVKAVLSAIGSCTSDSMPTRYAEPGEFTRRAFMNGRLSLPQVEALGDTLSAVTEEQRRLSIQGTIGGLGERYESWRRQLLDARGELEALIDFSEDQHLDESPADLTSSVAAQVFQLIDLIQVYQKNAIRGELLRNGITISLIGQPNVGKSSLLNLIAGRHAAIVSNLAGTTRDIVEVFVDLAGFYCRVGDTAGIRSPNSTEMLIDEVEQEGIGRAKARAMTSEVIILVLSVEASADSQGAQVLINDEIIQTMHQLVEARKEILVIVNKMDQYGTSASEAIPESIISVVQNYLPFLHVDNIFGLSCHLAEAGGSDLDPGNLQAFLDGLAERLRDITAPLTSHVHESDSLVWKESLGATERQRSLLDSCLSHLKVFEDQVASYSLENSNSQGEVDIVVAAESLRAAAADLAKITGRGEAGDVEEVLGVVFEKFCVGK